MKRNFLIIFIFAICFLSSCTLTEPDANNSFTGDSNLNSVTNSSTEVISNNNYEKINNCSLHEITELRHAKIEGIYPFSNDLVYISYFSSDRYYIGLLDLSKKCLNKKVKVTETDAATISCSMIENYFCVETREMVLSGFDIKQVSPVLTVYDANLEVMYRLQLSDVSPFGVVAFNINSDLSQVAYQIYENNENNLCINSADLSHPEYISLKNQIDSIQSLAFINDKYIAFVGEKDSIRIVGTINIDDGTIIAKTKNDASDKIYVLSSNALFFDKYTDVQNQSSGILYIANGEDGTIREVNTVDKNESQNVSFFSNENQIVTYLVKNQSDGTNVCICRIYDILVKEIINEYSLVIEGNMSSTNIISIDTVPKKNNLILLFQAGNASYIQQYQF